MYLKCESPSSEPFLDHLVTNDVEWTSDGYVRQGLLEQSSTYVGTSYHLTQIRNKILFVKSLFFTPHQMFTFLTILFMHQPYQANQENRNRIKNTTAPREGIFCLLLLFMHAKRVEDSRAIESRGPGEKKGFLVLFPSSPRFSVAVSTI